MLEQNITGEGLFEKRIMLVDDEIVMTALCVIGICASLVRKKFEVNSDM